MFFFQPRGYLGNPEEKKNRARRLCKLRRGPSHVFSRADGPTSEPASQPHVSRHGHLPMLLSSKGFQNRDLPPLSPQTDCQWAQLQRKLRWSIKSQENTAGFINYDKSHTPVALWFNNSDVIWISFKAVDSNCKQIEMLSGVTFPSEKTVPSTAHVWMHASDCFVVLCCAMTWLIMLLFR